MALARTLFNVVLPPPPPIRSASYTVEALLSLILVNMVSGFPADGITEAEVDFSRDMDFDRLDYSLEEGLTGRGGGGGGERVYGYLP